MANKYRLERRYGSKAATPLPAYDASMKPGTRVRFSGKFLTNTGQRTGGEGRKVFEVLGETNNGSWVIVNEAADVSYFTPEELTADPSLKFRRIAKANLSIVGKPTHRDDT